MKKIVVILSLVLFASSMFAQNSKVVSAFNYHRDGRLDKAKEMIDAAVVHNQTANQAKTWLYKGTIYLSIARSDNDSYRNLHPNPVQEAYDSYMKSLQIDPEYVQPTATPNSAKIGLFVVGELFYNKGVEHFNNGDYEASIAEFERTRQINNSFGIKDSIATYNAAVASVLIKDYDKAIPLYRDLINMNYRNPEIYSTLAQIYINKEEYDKALVVVRGGKSRFPDNLGVLIAETNIYLATDQIENAQNLLRIAVEKDPNNYLLYYAIGSNYDQLIEKEEDETERLKLISEAEKAYAKALELNPNYFEANYNMGVLFYEEGRRVYEAADKITDMKLYGVQEEKFNGYWRKALPFLEKANEIDENDINTLSSLRTLYARFNMMDKHKIVNEKILKMQE